MTRRLSPLGRFARAVHPVTRPLAAALIAPGAVLLLALLAVAAALAGLADALCGPPEDDAP